ncbi:MAG TPA: hypothetical protein VLA39_07395 [Marinobacterium sp.]|nr:hypothetical protein [Marinobacterium sp.]
MLGLSIQTYPAGAILPPHSHSCSQLCLLLYGKLIQWQFNGAGLIQGSLHRCGDLWYVDKSIVHSATSVTNVRLVTMKLRCPGISKVQLLGVASASLLAIQAARACDYSLADFERDQQTGMHIEVPDCFFENLEHAASGGDAQAQLELGISLIEGYSQDPSDSNLGTYWIKKAMQQGHPGAQNILDAYMEDYSC